MIVDQIGLGGDWTEVGYCWLIWDLDQIHQNLAPVPTSHRLRTHSHCQRAIGWFYAVVDVVGRHGGCECRWCVGIDNLVQMGIVFVQIPSPYGTAYNRG